MEASCCTTGERGPVYRKRRRPCSKLPNLQECNTIQGWNIYLPQAITGEKSTCVTSVWHLVPCEHERSRASCRRSVPLAVLRAAPPCFDASGLQYATTLTRKTQRYKPRCHPEASSMTFDSEGKYLVLVVSRICNCSCECKAKSWQ